MKKMKRLSVFLLIGLLIFSLFAPACGSSNAGDNSTSSSGVEEIDTSPFYTVQAAYEEGLLNKREITIIADYNNRHIYNTQYLEDEKVVPVTEIKQAYAEMKNKNSKAGNFILTADDIEVYAYLATCEGIYDTCFAVKVKEKSEEMAVDGESCSFELDGVTFNFETREEMDELLIYKRILLSEPIKPEDVEHTGPFYSLKNAYIAGFLTQEDLQTISDNNNQRKYDTQVLNDEIAMEIKQTCIRLAKENPGLGGSRLEVEDLEIYAFFGVYNDCYVIRIKDRTRITTDVERSGGYVIDGVPFTFQYYYEQGDLVVYKQEYIKL